MAGAFLYLCCCCSIHFKWVCKVLWNVFFTIMLVGSICAVSINVVHAQYINGILWVLIVWWVARSVTHQKSLNLPQGPTPHTPLPEPPRRPVIIKLLRPEDTKF